MRSTRHLLAVLALALLATGLAPGRLDAAVPLGGLAVAVTADGSRVIAGGDTRALYELDPKTLAVTSRTYLGRAIVRLAFSPDGARLWVESTKAVQMLDAKTLRVLQTFDDTERMQVAAKSGLLAVLSRRPAAVRILSMTDGSEQAQVPYDRMLSVAAFALAPDGAKLALMYRRKRSKDEPKVGYKEIPKELKGVALNEFKQRHDGYQSRFQVLDVAAKKALLDKVLWYGPPGGANRMCWRGDEILVAGYENQNARIAPDGSATYFELGNSYNYGLAFSADGTIALSGGLRKGSRTTLADGKRAALQLDALPGFPEYWKSFTLAANGTGYGGTSGCRVALIDASGKIVKLAPVY